MLILKKTFTFLVGFFLTLILVACNQTAEPVKTGNTENETEPETSEVEEINVEENTKDSELTLAEVLEKSMLASEELQSFAMKMDLRQEMSGAENMVVTSKIDMEVTSEPMALYQKMNMDVPGTSEQVQTEMYFTEEGIYMLQPMGTGWMKFPTEMSDQIMQSSPQQSNPAEELRKLQNYINDFTFEQDDKNYILSLSASGEEFTNFINETMQQSLSPDMIGEAQLSEEMTIKEIDYTVLIDKVTFYPTHINVHMVIGITADGQTVKLTQDMNGEYTQYNQIKQITIPQEALDSAEELEL